MSHLILYAICDADECNKLDVINYSTNPRELVTVGQMQQFEKEGTPYDAELECVGKA